MVSAYDSNLETYRAQHTALLPEYWIPVARYYDEALETITDTILPSRTFPRSEFKWRLFVDPQSMTPFTNEGAKTPMITEKAYYESYQTRFLKVGFYVTRRELDEGLPGVMQRLTKHALDSIKRRIEFVNIYALQGVTWNPVSTARLINLNRPTWQNSGGTPIADILIAMLRLWKRSGRRPGRIFLGPDDFMYLQNHNTMLTYLGLGSGIRGESDLLCKDMIQCIKTLKIQVVEGQFKEAPWAYALHQAGTPLPGSLGVGDTAFDSSTNISKHWMLRDRAIITADVVGFTAHSKSPASNNDQWLDHDTGTIYHKFEDEFCPVIEDYGKICVINFTGATYGTDDHPTVL